MSYAIARQPIYDRDGNVVAYEVFLRRKDKPDEYPKEVEFSKAAYLVTDIITELGFDRVAEGKKLVINFALETVLNKTIDILPFEKVVFNLNPPEVPLGEILYGKIVERLKDIVKEGGEILLNEKLYTGKYKDIFSLASSIEFTVQSLTKEKVNTLHSYKKKVMVTRIESKEDYEKAYDLGADLFEGMYLAPPELIQEVELAPFLKLTLLRLMSALSVAKSLKDIADIISSDVGMTVRFLQFVNSAYFARRKKIEDVSHAVAYLGLENIKKFLLLLALNDFVKIDKPELWKKSLIRAHIAEELVKNRYPELAEKAFLVGLFSLLDKILGVDIPSFLKELNIDDEIIKAFTGENKPLADILRIAVQL
ncbi:EAL and HDOD domain-containing protein, partial [Aquifex sp.]